MVVMRPTSSPQRAVKLVLLLTLLASLQTAATSTPAPATSSSSFSSDTSVAVANSTEDDWARPTVDVAGDPGRSATSRYQDDFSPRADGSDDGSEASVATATDSDLSSGLSTLVIIVAICGAIAVAVAVSIVAGNAWRMYKRNQEDASLDLGHERSVVTDYTAM